MNKEISQDKILSNLEYMLIELEKDINEVNNLEDKMYFELSRNELNNYISNVYSRIMAWNCYYWTKKYDLIISEYKNVESIISELELCLANLDDTFHMSGLSYSLLEIGEKLSNMKKRSVKWKNI